MANCMSGLQCHEDEFFDGCAKVGVIMTIQRSCCRELHHCRASTRIGCWFRVFQPVKIQKRIPRGLYRFFHFRTNACLGDPKTQKVDLCRLHGATSPHLSNKDWSPCVQNRSCDVLVVACPPRHPCDARGSNRQIVVHVSSRTSKDLISTGAHVVDFLCAVNTPSLRRNLQSLKRFLAKPFLERVQLCFQRWLRLHCF